MFAHLNPFLDDDTSVSGVSSFWGAVHWFLFANGDGRYSGSAISTLTEDVQEIYNAKSLHNAVDALLSKLEVETKFKPDDFLGEYSKQKFMRLLLYLLIYNEGAEDWVNKTRIGFDKDEGVLNEGFKPEFHHIFPRALLKKSVWAEETEKINSLANITVLNERTNRNKLRHKPFADYAKIYNIKPVELKAHLVPTAPSLREIKKFGSTDFDGNAAQKRPRRVNESCRSCDSQKHGD